MTTETAEKEFSLIRQLSQNPRRTQRELSGDVGLSLGMTNLLLKRLARKGLVKTQQLTWNKVQYLLTPKGMMEKTRKTFNYAAWALRHLKSLVARIQGILEQEHRAGRRAFYIVAQEDADELISMALEDLPLLGARVHRLSLLSEVPAEADTVFLATSETPPPAMSARFVALLEDQAAPQRNHPRKAVRAGGS